MQPTSTHILAIDYLDDDGTPIGSAPVEPDWESAFECAHFAAMRRGVVPAVLGAHRSSFQPIWHSEHGAPRIGAARVVFESTGVGGEFPAEPCFEDLSTESAFFRELAKQGSESMVEKGLLTAGQIYKFGVSAYANSATGVAPSDNGDARLQFEDLGETLVLREKPIEQLIRSASLAGRDTRDSDMRVFVPRTVVDEVVSAARAAGELEVGGMLLGHLQRSPGSPEIYVEVTAQVPAKHTQATKATLTFEPDSFAATNDAIALRGVGESCIGWWHSHPDFGNSACAQCPEERRRLCPLSSPFFSASDIHLHRTMFSRAYHTAMLVSDFGNAELDVSYFGWRDGAVVSRGFEVLEPDTSQE
jgi:proteasome lid subunit RPN8/RPN11